jgi:Protein of unknown function (DUF2924)
MYRAALALKPEHPGRLDVWRESSNVWWYPAGAGDMKQGSKLERDPQKLALQLEQLHELNSDQLREQWQTLFGADPPPKLRSSLLVQGIAYRLQEKALGGLKPATLRLLERIADDAAARRQVSNTPEKIRVNGGTVLVREWHGTKHQVTVLKDGYLYRAKRFHSLSQIARTITGSRWSRPLFFGLKSSRKEQSSEAA